MTWLVLGAGDAGEPWWIAVIKALIVVNLVLFGFAYLTLIERKVVGRMQLRYGPNRAGPIGYLVVSGGPGAQKTERVAERPGEVDQPSPPRPKDGITPLPADGK